MNSDKNENDPSKPSKAIEEPSKEKEADTNEEQAKSLETEKIQQEKEKPEEDKTVKAKKKPAVVTRSKSTETNTLLQLDKKNKPVKQNPFLPTTKEHPKSTPAAAKKKESHFQGIKEFVKEFSSAGKIAKEATKAITAARQLTFDKNRDTANSPKSPERNSNSEIAHGSSIQVVDEATNSTNNTREYREIEIDTDPTTIDFGSTDLLQKEIQTENTVVNPLGNLNPPTYPGEDLQQQYIDRRIAERQKQLAANITANLKDKIVTDKLNQRAVVELIRLEEGESSTTNSIQTNSARLLETINLRGGTTSIDPYTNQLVVESRVQQETNSTMSEIPITELLRGISYFRGDEKDLETFIDNADLYFAIVAESQKQTLLRIIKARITGEALNKIGNLASYESWEDLKQALKTKIKTIISFEAAQEEITNVKQKNTETIQEYGNRVKKLLQNLNNANLTLVDNESSIAALKIANEKIAIRKFEQNLLNETLKIIVSSSNKQTLEESVSYAVEREMWLRSTNVTKCNFCNKTGHLESECRTKMARNSNRNEPLARPGNRAQNIVCYKCNRPGHYASECRSSTPRNNNNNYNNNHNNDNAGNNNGNFNRNGNNGENNVRNNLRQQNNNHNNGNNFNRNGNNTPRGNRNNNPYNNGQNYDNGNRNSMQGNPNRQNRNTNQRFNNNGNFNPNYPNQNFNNGNNNENFDQNYNDNLYRNNNMNYSTNTAAMGNQNPPNGIQQIPMPTQLANPTQTIPQYNSQMPQQPVSMGPNQPQVLGHMQNLN